MRKLTVLLLIAMLFITVCSFSYAKDTIIVYTGAGISPPMDEIAKNFEKKNNCKVECSYKGSGCLLADITIGKRGDIYMPGELFFMKQAIDRGFIKKYKNTAYWSPVIITPRNNPKNIKNLNDLTKPGVRVALGDDKAAAIGRYSKNMLEKLGLYEKIKKNQVYTSLTVNELAVAVKLGHADAAIVWAATAVLINKDCKIILIPEAFKLSTPIPAGILKFTKHPELSEKFLEYLSSDEVKGIFEKYGYFTSQEHIEEDLKKIEKRNREIN